MGKWLPILLPAGLFICFIVILVIAINTANAPEFEYEKNYRFKYTYAADLVINNVTSRGRTFVLENNKNFSVPVWGSRGELIAILDLTVPTGYFRIRENKTPEIKIAGIKFQEARFYREVHYNFSEKEEQKFIPQISLQ